MSNANAIKPQNPFGCSPRTIEQCQRAIEIDSGNFYYIPDELKTFDLCLMAVSKNPM